MKKLLEFFDAHWEKLIFGCVALFCVYSLSISLFGLFGASNEELKIIALNTETSDVLLKGKAEPINLHEKVVIDFQKEFEKKEGFDAYQKLILARLFSEEAKTDPYEKVKDIVQGHSTAGAIPGPSCEKFFCKVKGENICLICGSKGEREYKTLAPKLTDLSSIRQDIRSSLISNPYMDRQKIRIIWEDDIETDRSVFKDRKASVYRIEITDKNQKILMDMIDKPSYQIDMRNFIVESKANLFMKGGNILELVGENVGGSAIYKAPVKERETPVDPKKETPPMIDLFKNDAATPANDKKEVEKTEVSEFKMHLMHDEKVFYNFEDITFEPLKKYRYVLIETFKGKSHTQKDLLEWRFSKPVDITTGAENIFYLTRVVPQLNEEKQPVLKDGKTVFNAEFRIYQYIKAQNLFYKKDFRELRVGDEIGSFIRKYGKEENIIKTAIFNTKSKAALRGTELSDEEWKKWNAMYPGSLKARSDRVEIELSYFTGHVIKEIGEEKVQVMVKDGPLRKTGKFNEKGEEILEQKFKQTEVDKKYVVMENVLTKAQTKVYNFENKEISDDLELNGVKTIEDIKDEK